ncbi:MAG: hypothetical protein JWL76_2252 [Thermoleophilia bacterium]|nr:hypothetical protein [Thermoleophilia bacterium]
MTGPRQRDPRARRWTFVLVLLALIVVAGVGLRVVDERRRDADQTAENRARTREEAGAKADADAQEPARTDQEPDAPETPATSSGSGSAALDEPLGISISMGTDVDGDPILLVDRLGPLVLDSAASIPYVTGVLGEPDNVGANPDDANVCDASWVAWGLEAQFYFGQPPSPEAACEKGPIAAALMTGERWFIEPLTGGGAVLTVGDPVSSIATAFPDSKLQRLPPGLASLAANQQGHLVVEGSYAGEAFPTLYAIGVDGSIASFLYVSGAE